MGKTDCGSNRRSAGDTYQQPLFLGKPFGEFYRFIAGYLLYPVDDREIESVRNEAGADTLNLVRTGLERLAGKLSG